MTIHEISRDEYMAGLQSEVQKNGLLDAVKKRLDEINHVALTLNYANWGLVQEMSVEIIDLLKAQEPRVMTTDEIGTWVMIDRVDRAPIVVEVRDRFITWIVGDEYYDLPECNLSSEFYGKTWRCWTTKPDEKVRAETPWE